ncbi:MAG TPA: G1 family glutamic endopeptidase, partial [Dokdonella sp.]
MRHTKTIGVTITIYFIIYTSAVSAQQIQNYTTPLESSIPEAGFVIPDGRIGHPLKDPIKRELFPSLSMVSFLDGQNWGGQVAALSSENFYSAEGSFKIPTSIRCNSTRDLFAPWIGLNGFGNNTVQQAGVA